MTYEEFETFFTLSSDEQAAFLAKRAGPPACCGHDHPELHRIMDVLIGDAAFRISRCVTCRDTLFVARVDHAIASEISGVPLALRGERLADWVAEERRNPSKDPVDWQSWMDPRSQK